MKSYYIDQKVLLRKNMKIGQIIKPLPSDKSKFVVSYYDDDNKLQYDIITEVDIIEEEEYEIIRKRVNTINKLLKP